jgi:hypothetical protein
LGYSSCWIVPSALAFPAAIKFADLPQQSSDIRLRGLASMGICAKTMTVAQLLP